MKEITCIRSEANMGQILHCKNTIEELEHSFELLSGALSLAGNAVRLKILFLIAREGRLCVCDLSDILEMKIPAVSQHLRKLKDRRILRPEREAQTIYYQLTPKYEALFAPFFELIDGNKILQTT